MNAKWSAVPQFGCVGSNSLKQSYAARSCADNDQDNPGLRVCRRVLCRSHWASPFEEQAVALGRNGCVIGYLHSRRDEVVGRSPTWPCTRNRSAAAVIQLPRHRSGTTGGGSPTGAGCSDRTETKPRAATGAAPDPVTGEGGSMRELSMGRVRVVERGVACDVRSAIGRDRNKTQGADGPAGHGQRRRRGNEPPAASALRRLWDPRSTVTFPFRGRRGPGFGQDRCCGACAR